MYGLALVPPATLTPAPPQQRYRGSELEALVRYPLRLSALSQSRGPRPHALFEFPRLKRTRARLRTANPTRVSSRCSAPGGGICPAFGRHLTTRRLWFPSLRFLSLPLLSLLPLLALFSVSPHSVLPAREEWPFRATPTRPPSAAPAAARPFPAPRSAACLLTCYSAFQQAPDQLH